MGSPLLQAFIFLVVILESPATANLIIDEVFSREELVKMAGYGEDKISTVQIEGKVVCQTCTDGDESSSLHPISGALVGILCSRSGRRASYSWVKGSTHEHGGFLIDLPSHLHAIPNLENTCLVRVLHLPKASICTQQHYYSRAPKHKGIQLIGVQEGTRSYTTHTIHLTPKSC